ncbi:hypothetical protein cyc_01132 [Cyclospora cayetanensis]|uniref:Uncharacterized protein n=1 Tax=Cyclospora cayetanensis TaxID=88456 RepID=A0A1D3CYK9_9EIME|nr:hypothetical protein cyc_01132 [Cyclospora cayetanensis]
MTVHHEHLESPSKLSKDGKLSEVCSFPLLWRVVVPSVCVALVAVARTIALSKVQVSNDPKRSEFAHINSQSYRTDDLRLLLKELEHTWADSSEGVRASFTEYYMPHFWDTLSSDDPISVFRRDVNELLGVKEPSETAFHRGTARYKLRWQFAIAVVRAATVRLLCLKEIQAFVQKRGLKSAQLALLVRSMPSESLLLKKNDLVSFQQFMWMLRGDGPFRSASTYNQQAGVPLDLVIQLVNGILFAEMQLQHSQRVHACYKQFLAAAKCTMPWGNMMNAMQVTENLPMIHNGKKMIIPAAYFCALLGSLGKLRRDAVPPPETIASWANDWSIRGVLSLLYVLDEDTCFVKSKYRWIKSVFLNRWLAQKLTPPPTSHDLFALGVALL